MYKIVAKGPKGFGNQQVPTMGCNFALPGMLLFALIGILIRITPSCGPNGFGGWPIITNFAGLLQAVLEPSVAGNLKLCAFSMNNVDPEQVFRVTSCGRAGSSWDETSVTYWSRYTVSNIGAGEDGKCLVVRNPVNKQQPNCSATHTGENELICAGGTFPHKIWDVEEQQCSQDRFKVDYFDNTGKKVLSPKTGTEWVFPGLFGLYFPLLMKRGYWELSIPCELFLKNGNISKILNVYSRLDFGDTINIADAKAEIDSVTEMIDSGAQYVQQRFEKVFEIN